MARFGDVLFILLGWLLGTLTPGITEAIKRPKHKAELLSAIKTELTDLRYKVAIVAHRMRGATGTMSKQTLDIVRPIILEHQGPEEDRTLGDSIRKLMALGEENYIAVHNERDSNNKSPYPVPYTAPFLVGHLNEIAIFGQATQATILRADAELHLFNEQVSYVRACHDRTFATLSSDNFRINQGNLDAAQGKLADRAEILVWALTKVIDSGV